MAEEPENNEEVETPDVEAPSEDAAPTPDMEASAQETAANASDEAPTPEASEESSVDEPAAEAAEAEPEPAAAPAPAAEPEAPIAPKERRQRARAAKAAPARPQRTPEERHADRVAERQAKAKARSARRKREREKARAQRGAAETPEPLAALRGQHLGRQKIRQGIVVSDRASKTIVVRIDVARRHRFYEKIVRTSTTLHAHDEREDAHIGDTVAVRESRPLSRTKRWRLVEVLERAK
jgi:small subunit ribosomal protein S17